MQFTKQSKNRFQRTSRDQKLMMSLIKFIVSRSPSETWLLNCDIAKITIRVSGGVSNVKHLAEIMLLRKFSNSEILLENFKLSYSCSKFLFGGRGKGCAFPTTIQTEN